MKQKFVLSLTMCLLTAMALGIFAYGAKQDIAPVAENLEIETCRNVSVSGQLKATSASGSVLKYEITTQPNKGVIELGSNGEFVYTPGEGKRGSDYFGYKATDAEGRQSAEATVIIRIRKQKTNVCYSDMAGNGSEYAAIVLAENNVFTGENIGGKYVFNPDAAVSRGEFLTMCLKVTDCDVLTGVITTGFADDETIPDYQKPYVSTALLTGVICGYSNGLKTAVFSGDNGITYAEAAVMLDRALKLSDVNAATFLNSAPDWAAQSCANLSACNIVKSGSDAYGTALNRADCSLLLLGAIQVMAAR